MHRLIILHYRKRHSRGLGGRLSALPERERIREIEDVRKQRGLGPTSNSYPRITPHIGLPPPLRGSSLRPRLEARRRLTVRTRPSAAASTLVGTQSTPHRQPRSSPRTRTCACLLSGGRLQSTFAWTRQRGQPMWGRIGSVRGTTWSASMG